MTDTNNTQALDTTILQKNEPNKLKTNDYTLNAVKKYRLKNAKKVKEYNQLYIKKKKEEKKTQNIYIDFKKTQLYYYIYYNERYIEMSRQKKEIYSKIKFFELLRTNIFFKKYYKDTLGSTYNIITGWIKV